ncbi:MAG: hypothetical protein ACXABY_00930 [Candidatus Thorarchaeota archaeon]|jgi:hypothetical protein
MNLFASLLETKLKESRSVFRVIRGGRHVPDVGAKFTYKGRKYRVTGWCRVRKPKQLPLDVDWLDQVLEPDPNETTYEWCLRKEATHVTGAGIAGVRAPVKDIKVTGMVNWPEEHLKSERRHANTLGINHEIMY